MKKLRFGLAGALLASALIAGPAAAAPGPRDTDCLRSGIAVLQANGGISFFARNGVPVSLIDPTSSEILPLSTVLRLHLTNPELWPWC
ncbi:MAG TPA: hypothetical protein VMP67_06300 [Candidatus Limnocylindria bacterium]|nr:hypothetical protein [Candidatus Limnocylindria bacterium]